MNNLIRIIRNLFKKINSFINPANHLEPSFLSSGPSSIYEEPISQPIPKIINSTQPTKKYSPQKAKTELKETSNIYEDSMPQPTPIRTYSTQQTKKFSKSQPKSKLKESSGNIELVAHDEVSLKTYRVGFDILRHKLDYKYYPTVLMPKFNTIIKPPQIGRNGNVGASEVGFVKHVKSHFETVMNISNNMSVFTQGKNFPYEPDLALWNIIQDNLICIDIEIDEPYAGATGEPTHCYGYDIERNRDFLNRGWIVIRFSEEQVVEYPTRCCTVIAEVLSDIIGDYKIPKSLSNITPLNREGYWDENQSKLFARNKTRENLLNLEYGFGTVQTKQIKNNTKDKFIESEQSVVNRFKEFDSLISQTPKRRSSINSGGQHQIMLDKSLTSNTNKSSKVYESVPDSELYDRPTTNTIVKTEPKSSILTKPNKPKTKSNSANVIYSESTNRRVESLEKDLDAMASKEKGVSKKGTLSAGATTAVPSRHYGGKIDKRVYELMKAKPAKFSYALRQKNNIEKDFDFLDCKIIGETLICKGKVHPENCSEYSLRIECIENDTPKVFITKPTMVTDPKKHMYSDGSLCLFYPKDLKWQNSLNIAKYFVPWAIEWILCYELHELTGEWRHDEAPRHISITEK